MYLFANIQALQLLHDKQHEERDKGNRNKKLDIDVSCSRCYKTPKERGDQFNNFCDMFTDITYAEGCSGLTVKIFNEILRIDPQKNQQAFEDKFEQLVWAFRYIKDFNLQNGELRSWFIRTMALSEKFTLNYEETRVRLRAHYEAEYKEVDDRKDESSEKFTG